MGKLLEKIVNKRLEYFIESNKILNKSQCGFRRNLSTMDVLLRVVNEIKSATQIGEVCGVFYIDLKSAFDTVWRKGILYKLAQKGLQGKLFKMICAFLEDRSIRVIMGETQSDEKNTEAGTPQGAVLSPKLFNILM